MDSLISAPWRKSSHSGNNGTDCVEVATWRKSSHSGNDNSTDCVEAGVAARGRVLVRDTTNRDGIALDIPAAAWDRFTSTLK